MLIVTLYIICSLTVVLVMVILFLDFDYYVFAMFEYYTIIFFLIVSNLSSSYERSGANTFIIFFSFVMSFGVVINNSLSIMSLMLMMLGLANLPMYGLHMWLPKVHVEASMVSSIVLASAVLKLGILYCWNFGGLILISLLLVISVVVIIVVIDSNGFAAYSSVLHISMCVIFGLIVMILVGYIHIILSPLIFMTVYKIYSCNGSRFYLNSGLLMMILWLVNFGLPFVGSFFSEVYMMQYVSLMLGILVVMYIMVGYVAMNSLNIDSNGLFYIPFLVLYMLMI